MPHIVRESHLETICCNCKHQGKKELTLLHHHHKTYIVIKCISCGYETIKLRKEIEFNNRFEFM